MWAEEEKRVRLRDDRGENWRIRKRKVLIYRGIVSRGQDDLGLICRCHWESGKREGASIGSVSRPISSCWARQSSNVCLNVTRQTSKWVRLLNCFQMAVSAARTVDTSGMVRYTKDKTAVWHSRPWCCSTNLWCGLSTYLCSCAKKPPMTWITKMIKILTRTVETGLACRNLWCWLETLEHKQTELVKIMCDEFEGLEHSNLYIKFRKDHLQSYRVSPWSRLTRGEVQLHKMYQYVHRNDVLRPRTSVLNPSNSWVVH